MIQVKDNNGHTQYIYRWIYRVKPSAHWNQRQRLFSSNKAGVTPVFLSCVTSVCCQVCRKTAKVVCFNVHGFVTCHKEIMMKQWKWECFMTGTYFTACLAGHCVKYKFWSTVSVLQLVDITLHVVFFKIKCLKQNCNCGLIVSTKYLQKCFHILKKHNTYKHPFLHPIFWGVKLRQFSEGPCCTTEPLTNWSQWENYQQKWTSVWKHTLYWLQLIKMCS